MIAIASILVAIGPINGPLLQRASLVAFGKITQPVQMEIRVAQSLPDGYTGYLSGRARLPALLTPEFTKVVSAANTNEAIKVSSTGCSGECATSVRGAGFAITCKNSTASFSLTPSDNTDGNYTSQEAIGVGTQAFGSRIRWSSTSPETIRTEIQYKSTPPCDGDLQLRNCTMRAATMQYPVIVNGITSTIKLTSGSTMFEDTVHEMTTVTLNTMMGSTTLGGLSKALSDIYDSTANLRFAGAYRYELVTVGATSNRYAIVDGANEVPYADCSLSFADASDDIIQAVRDMMFRTAMAAANSLDSQKVSAEETVTLAIYQSNHRYLGLAVLFTGLSWLATFPIFIRWWHVGGAVSMSPVEMAKAFSAPMLKTVDSNADANTLLRHVGDRPIRYGAVATSDSGLDILEMNEPHLIRTPCREQSFVG